MIAFPAAMLIFATSAASLSMTIVTRPPVIESPCIRVCAIDPDSGLCRGCGRNLAEITRWIGLTDADRTRIMAELPARLELLRQADVNRRKQT